MPGRRGQGADAFREIGVDDLPAVRERARGGNVVWIDAEDATDEELDAPAGDLRSGTG